MAPHAAFMQPLSCVSVLPFAPSANTELRVCAPLRGSIRIAPASVPACSVLRAVVTGSLAGTVAATMHSSARTMARVRIRMHGASIGSCWAFRGYLHAG